MALVRRVLTVLALALGAALQGCGGPTFVVQEYGGDVRPRETIAVIRINGDESVLLDSLDGQNIGVQVPSDSKLYVEVLPGKHTVGIVDGMNLSSPARYATFRAEAGKFYRPAFPSAASLGEGESTGGARVYEINGSDEPIRDVTLRAGSSRTPKARAPEASPSEAPTSSAPAAPAPSAPAAATPDAGSDAAPSPAP